MNESPTGTQTTGTAWCQGSVETGWQEGVMNPNQNCVWFKYANKTKRLKIAHTKISRVDGRLSFDSKRRQSRRPRPAIDFHVGGRRTSLGSDGLHFVALVLRDQPTNDGVVGVQRRSHDVWHLNARGIAGHREGHPEYCLRKTEMRKRSKKVKIDNSGICGVSANAPVGQQRETPLNTRKYSGPLCSEIHPCGHAGNNVEKCFRFSAQEILSLTSMITQNRV